MKIFVGQILRRHTDSAQNESERLLNSVNEVSESPTPSTGEPELNGPYHNRLGDLIFQAPCSRLKSIVGAAGLQLQIGAQNRPVIREAQSRHSLPGLTASKVG